MQLVNKCSFVILQLITRTAVNFALKKKKKRTPNQKQTQKSLTQQRLLDTSPHPTLVETSLEKQWAIWDWIWRIFHGNPSHALLGEKPSCSLSSPGQRDGKGHTSHSCPQLPHTKPACHQLYRTGARNKESQTVRQSLQCQKVYLAFKIK